MNQSQHESCQLVPLAEAERICCGKTGMTAAQFRHELAEHVRGNGGIPWVATATAVGVYRAALEQIVRDTQNPPSQETHDD